MPSDIDTDTDTATAAGATRSLLDHAHGNRAAAAQLMPLVYANLRALAADYMRHERPDHSLQPTALVHEAYLRMIDISQVDWAGKTHFFAVAARQMRRVLIEHARRVGALKRGGGLRRIVLEDDLAIAAAGTLDLLALDRALEKLTALNRRHGRVAELRLFAGLGAKDAAFVLGVSERTAREDWRWSRAWLARELGRAD